MAAPPNSLLRPPPLSAIPKGLLAFLGIRNGGQYPQTLNPVLQPTWDLQEHYENAYSDVFLQGPVNLAAGGTTADVNFGTTIGFVPFNQLAHVQGYTVRCDLAGLSAVTATPTVFYNGVGIAMGPAVTFAAGSLATWHTTQRFWMPPNSSLGVVVNSKTLADALAFYAVFRSTIYEY